MRRVIGMDIHRTFGEVVFWEDGRLRPAGRIGMTQSALEGFGRTLSKDDEVVIEATGNAMAVGPRIEPSLRPRADLFGGLGRAWLGKQPLPQDEEEAIERHLRELDRLGEDLSGLDRALAQAAIGDPAVKRLLTVAGINLTVAVGLTAAIGDVSRFASPQKLISYVGLNPRVRQSGLGFAQHGRISKQGRAHARSMLVEAAWAAANAPGPWRAFFLRIRARRGHQIAAVAVARKLTVLCWHLLTKEADYLWARPALVANKLRSMKLQAGMPAKKGNKRGPAYAYNVKELRERETEVARQAERAYEHFVGRWQTGRPPARRTGAAKEERR
jgi:hypothetical protein